MVAFGASVFCSSFLGASPQPTKTDAQIETSPMAEVSNAIGLFIFISFLGIYGFRLKLLL